MRYQSFQFNRHHIMLSIVIISLLTISGCTSTVDDKSGGKSEPEKANGIELNIPIESQSGLLLHAEDIEALQNELLSIGATEIEVTVESEGKTVLLSSPSELSEGEYTGLLKIYTQGDYDKLSNSLATESSYISKLEAWGFDVDVKPYLPKSS